jgi:cell division protein YceG involved in septum cleavage
MYKKPINTINPKQYTPGIFIITTTTIIIITIIITIIIVGQTHHKTNTYTIYTKNRINFEVPSREDIDTTLVQLTKKKILR